MTDRGGTAGASEALADLLRGLSSPVEYATVAATLAVLVLGAYVAYQAYRGYRRNDDRAVLFLGLGVLLVTTVRQVASVVAYLVVGSQPLPLLFVFFGVSLTGLAAVLYAFVWA